MAARRRRGRAVFPSTTTDSSRAAKRSVGIDRYRVDFTATTGKQNRWYQFTRPTYGDRRDADRKLLTYDTPPMQADTELAGWPVLTLHISAATTDPAIFAYLEDVAPDGRVTYITEGQLRAINRKPAEPSALPYDSGPAPHTFNRADALPVTPGEFFTVAIKLFAVAALIQRGHLIRLAIAGARLGDPPQLPMIGTPYGRGLDNPK